MGNKHSARVLLVGLDNSGKNGSVFSYVRRSTAVNHLAGRHDVQTTPSTGFATEKVKMKGKYELEIYDIAGGEKLRNLWRHYYDGAKAIDRFGEAKEELKKIVQSPELTHIPVLVLANKSDLKDKAVPLAELSEAMDLKALLHGRQWTVLESSSKTGKGLDDGLKWFVKTFKETEKAEHK